MNEGTLRKINLLIPIAICAGYFVFIIATWMQFQNDRARRDEKINEILDRMNAASMERNTLAEPPGAEHASE